MIYLLDSCITILKDLDYEDRALFTKRLFDGTLDFAMKTKCVVVVEGPKWCGKSTTCKRHVKEVVDLMPIQTREDLVREAKIVGRGP